MRERSRIAKDKRKREGSRKLGGAGTGGDKTSHSFKGVLHFGRREKEKASHKEVKGGERSPSRAMLKGRCLEDEKKEEYFRRCWRLSKKKKEERLLRSISLGKGSTLPVHLQMAEKK